MLTSGPQQQREKDGSALPGQYFATRGTFCGRRRFHAGTGHKARHLEFGAPAENCHGRGAVAGRGSSYNSTTSPSYATSSVTSPWRPSSSALMWVTMVRLGAISARCFGERADVVDVEIHDLVEEIRFADEQVGLAAGGDQLLDPFGVAGVGEHLALGLDAQRVGRRAAIVLHEVGRDVAGRRLGALM